jgi:malate dehydrogenase
VTGAAGQIGYALAPLLASGALLGAGTPVALRLLEVAVPAVQTALGGLAMELDDAAYPTLASVTATADPAVAFAGAHVAILVGAFPRKAGVERGELLRRNGGIFRAQGAALAAHAHPDVKVLIVGNPANTNALILARAAAGRIPPRNITALTRLDHNRVVGALARHFGVLPSAVSGVAIWGNHSSTQYPDVTRARVAGAVDAGGVVAALGGRAAVAETFIPMIQKRGAAIIAARGASSAASAAAAIGDHVRSWLLGDPAVVSMAVCSQGEYGVEPGVFFSFPVRCTGGGAYEVVEGLELDDFSRKYIAASADELYAERSEALAVCASL